MYVNAKHVEGFKYHTKTLKVSSLISFTFIIIYIGGLFSKTPLRSLFSFFPELLFLFITCIILYKNKGIKSHISVYIILILITVSLISYSMGYSDPTVYTLGFRTYFKFFLAFSIPLMLRKVSFEKIKKSYLKLILVLALIQFPITIIQKFILFQGKSGDLITGSLGANSSGELTQFLFFTIPLMISLYLSKQNGLLKTILYILILFIPTTINETKVTFLFIGALGLFFVFISNSVSFRNKLIILSLTPILLYGFFIAYEKFNPYNKKKGNPILNIINETASGNLYESNYFMKDGSLNRIPNVQFAYANISKNIDTFFLGVSIGNASDSFLPKGVGKYFKKFDTLNIDGIQASRMIWEWGIIGSLLWISFFGMLFSTSLSLKENTYAIWFSAICVISAIGFIYTNNLLFDQLGYYFWFLAGIVVREKLIENEKQQHTSK